MRWYAVEQKEGEETWIVGKGKEYSDTGRIARRERGRRSRDGEKMVVQMMAKEEQSRAIESAARQTCGMETASRKRKRRLRELSGTGILESSRGAGGERASVKGARKWLLLLLLVSVLISFQISGRDAGTRTQRRRKFPPCSQAHLLCSVSFLSLCVFWILN